MRSAASSRQILRALGLSLMLVAAPLQGGQAQIISPGKLAAPHSHLEGMKNCTACHELRRRGTDNDLCLACHEPLQQRIEQNRGYHATVAHQNCAECHKDHFEREFEMVRFDTTRFDHDQAGFELVEAHAEAGCRTCHVPDLVRDASVRAFKAGHDALATTYLGLGTACTACHEPDDPHGGQFLGRRCQECHTQTAWKQAEYFDHGNTRYLLTGLHRQVACEACHRPLGSNGGDHDLEYVGIAFSSCKSCHSDIHEGSMVEACASCHVTGGWLRIDRSTFDERFDHSSTEFALTDAHAELDCLACHGKPPAQDEWLSIEFTASSAGKLYPTPFAADCLSCHRDYHQSAFEQIPGGLICDNCHGEQKWMPASYDIDRHNRETDFVLNGAHLAVPCFRCHENPELGQETREFAFESQECTVCHRRDDPHGGQFTDVPCTQCHDTRSFEIAAFDHAATRYPLDGAHRSVPCGGCHFEETSAGIAFVRYAPLGTECRDCHGGSAIER